MALQKLQEVAMILCRMAFWLSGKMVALHLDNCTAKANLCNHGGMVYPFPSRLDKHSITLIPTYILTHLNVEANYLSWGQLLPEWHLPPHMAQAAIHLWVLPEVDLLASSSCISSSSCVQDSGGTCQRSNQIFDSGGTMSDGDLLAFPQFSTCWQMFLGTVPS